MCCGQILLPVGGGRPATAADGGQRAAGAASGRRADAGGEDRLLVGGGDGLLCNLTAAVAVTLPQPAVLHFLYLKGNFFTNWWFVTFFGTIKLLKLGYVISNNCVF